MHLVRYEQAKQAIAAYKTVDEVKDFRDKAAAIELYAKQAKDFELERDAKVARLRAERKFGQLYGSGDKAKGTDKGGTGYDSRKDRPSFSPPKTLSELGVTKDQSSKWQRMAEVPEKDFEEVMQGEKPSTALNAFLKVPLPETKQKKMHANALWWHGTLRRASEERYALSFKDTLAEMNDLMRGDMEEFINELLEWIDGK